MNVGKAHQSVNVAKKHKQYLKRDEQIKATEKTLRKLRREKQMLKEEKAQAHGTKRLNAIDQIKMNNKLKKKILKDELSRLKEIQEVKKKQLRYRIIHD